MLVVGRCLKYVSAILISGAGIRHTRRSTNGTTYGDDRRSPVYPAACRTSAGADDDVSFETKRPYQFLPR
jgi:hypothetical protein